MNIDEIRTFFEGDGYLTMTGVMVEDAAVDWCLCSLEVRKEHLNAGGAVQGGAIYTLADSAFAVASNTGHLENDPAHMTVSQSAAISYMSAGRPGKKLFAEARKIGGGKRSPVFRIDVTDEDGRNIAMMTGNGAVIERK